MKNYFIIKKNHQSLFEIKLDFNQLLFEAVSHIANEINPKHFPPGYATARNALKLAVDRLNTCFSL